MEPIRVVIWFEDGDKKEIKIDALQGAFSFITAPDSRIARIWVSAPDAAVEPLEAWDLPNFNHWGLPKASD